MQVPISLPVTSRVPLALSEQYSPLSQPQVSPWPSPRFQAGTAPRLQSRPAAPPALKSAQLLKGTQVPVPVSHQPPEQVQLMLAPVQELLRVRLQRLLQVSVLMQQVPDCVPATTVVPLTHTELDSVQVQVRLVPSPRGKMGAGPLLQGLPSRRLV
jgi:hypothetical protein